jgi:hypothetical protein
LPNASSKDSGVLTTGVAKASRLPKKLDTSDFERDPINVRCRNATRTFKFLGSLASLGLAVCVFAWGLQYKLSLYDSPKTASQHIQQAKLLSRNERIGATESPQVVRTRTSTRVSYAIPTAVFLILFLPFSISKSQASGRTEPRTSHPWNLRRGLFNIFFVRPPPLLA